VRWLSIRVPAKIVKQIDRFRCDGASKKRLAGLTSCLYVHQIHVTSPAGEDGHLIFHALSSLLTKCPRQWETKFP
jgi:hypothetical protein